MVCWVGTFGVSLVPRIGHADAFDRVLLDAVDGIGRRDACRFEDGRHDIDDVMELAANATHIVDVAGPRHRHALSGPAEVRRNLLHPLKWRVHRPRPTRCKMRERAFRTPEWVPKELVLHRHGNAIEGRELVRCAVEHALGTRAVVATDVDDQGIVEFAEIFDGLNDAPDLMVGVGEVGPINIRLPDEELLLLPTEGIPLR